MSKHAILGPSGASKWLVCTPSARLEQQFPDSSGDAAREGTLAHSLGELLISLRTNKITNKKYREELAIIEDNPMYNKAMHEYADSYAIYVLERLSEAQAHTADATLYIEQKLDLTAYIPEGFGTGDAAIVADTVADIVDLKYGKGVPVTAVENTQLKIYALGWLDAFEHLFNIRTIRMHIYQPRLNNISVYEMSVEDLKAWADETLRPKALIAFEGQGEYVAGKHCQFCRAKVTCKANAVYNLGIAGEDFKDIEDDIQLADPAILTDTQIARILEMSEGLTSWVNAVKDYALAQALAGRLWPGYKLVAGRSVRKITDKEAVAKLLIKDGFDRLKIYKPQELIGITDMEKLAGKKFFDEKVAPFTVKAPGAPALVPAADKRPAINSADAAADDFKDITD